MSICCNLGTFINQLSFIHRRDMRLGGPLLPFKYLFYTYILLSTFSLLTDLLVTSQKQLFTASVNIDRPLFFVEGHSSKVVDEDFIEQTSDRGQMSKPDKDLTIGNADYDESVQPEVYVLFCTS